MKSRRKVFRYGNFQLPVTFKTAYDDGTAILVNISTGGCALERVAPDLCINDAFLLTIESENREHTIEAKCIVLRIDGTQTAAKFTRITDSRKSLIRNYFAGKLRNRS